MPPKSVTTVRQLIYWEYAKLIAKAAGYGSNFAFISSRYKKLVSGEMHWSSSIRDYENELQKGRVCTYCGSTVKLSLDHLIPISRCGVDPRVKSILDSTDNIVCACNKCNSSKGDKDIFEWYRGKENEDIPGLALSKFLKNAYRLHETQGTLDLKDPNMDGELNILDLGVVITNLISHLCKAKSQPNK